MKKMAKRKSNAENAELQDKQDEIPIKLPKLFSVHEFRSKLHGPDAMKSIRDFSNLAEAKDCECDVVIEYLDSGGSIMELVSLLDVTAQADLATAMPVFRAVYLILLRIQSADSHYKVDAKPGVENLLSTYIPAIQAMIALNSGKHRKIVLKMLTTIITLYQSYGREILNWLSLTRPQIDQLLEPGPVRKAFVMFLVAFFLEGDASLFKPLLEKKGLLSKVLPGLMFDDTSTVTVVLTVLQEKALKNPSIPKTWKLNVFNTQILQSLFGLYNWIGPRGVQKGFKKSKKLVGADAEAKSAVTAALTDFLRALCTSRKHGVIFWDKTLGTGPPMNQLMLTALEVVPKPWENEQLSELVIDILNNSPDLIKPYLSRLEPYFEARESSSSWEEALMFLSKVITGLDTVAIMTSAKESLNQSQLQAAIRGVSAPRVIMKHLASAVAPEKVIAVRFHALCVFSVILRKLNHFLNALQEHGNWTEKHRKTLMQPLLKVFPNIANVRHMWRVPRDEKPSEQNSSLEESEIYQAVSEYFLQVALLDPNLVENPRKLSRLLTKNLESLENMVKVNVLQAVSLLDSAYLAPNSMLFEEALKTLLILSCSEDTRQDSLAAAVRMLQSTGLFDSNKYELDLWIGAWLAVPEFAQSTIAQLLVAAVRKCFADRLEKETTADEHLFKEGGKHSPSPLIFAIFNAAKEEAASFSEDMALFLKNITLKIIHLYGPCEALNKEISNNLRWLSVDMTSYFTKFDPSILQEPQEIKLGLWLLKKKKEPLDLSEFQLDVYQWSSLFHLTLYYVRYCLIQGQFDEKAQYKCKGCIELTLNELCPLDSVINGASTVFSSSSRQNPAVFFHKCLNSLLQDMTLLDNFDAFGSEFAAWLRNVFESLRLDKMDPGGQRRIIDDSLLLPWKHHFLLQLEIYLKKEQSVATPDLQFWMEFLQPTVQELEPLLSSMCVQDRVNFPEGWGKVFRIIIAAIGTRKISNRLMQRLLQVFEGAIFSEGGVDFDEALLLILKNFPLSVFYLNADFLENVLRQPTISGSLIQAAELFLQMPGYNDKLLDLICQLNENSYDPYTILLLLGKILKKEEHNHIYEIKVTFDNDVNFFWPTEVFGMDIKSYRKKITIRLAEALKKLYSALSKSLRRFIRGKQDNALSENIDIVLLLLRLHMKYPEERETIKKSLKGGCPQPCVMSEVIYGLEPNDDRDAILMHCARTLCVVSEVETPWLLHADTIESLTSCVPNSQVWSQFVKTQECTAFMDAALRELSLTGDSNILRVLNSLVSAGWKIGDANEELADIFHKCTSHMEFLNIILSSSQIKVQVIRLVLTLIQRCPNVMALGQVPAFLAAYGATLSTCDQLLLQVLRVYERHCGSLSKFEPLFWGTPAISHYSVRGSIGLSLWRQVTMKSVLQLLDLSKVKMTIADFPIQRTLYGGMEKIVMADVYDPAFLLPLFSNLFSPGAVSYCLTFIHQGALSFTVAALSSRDSKMRAAAAVVISRFYSHLQLVHYSKLKPIWLHILDCLRYGLEDLENKPVSSVVAVFLARAILEVAEPLGALYSLHNFLLAKPAFNLNILPEFLPLFFSSDHRHQKHRQWILEVIRDGMRGEVDLNLTVNGPAYKIILSFFESSLASTEVKVVILQVLQKMVQAPNSCRIILGFGLLSWLRRICRIITGPLLEPFLQLVANVNSVVHKEQRLSRTPLQCRVEVVLKQLIAGSSDRNGEEALARLEQVIFT